jgi:hypothetical protein
MLRRVARVRTDVSEELSASFSGVTRIGDLGTSLALKSGLTRATRRIIPDDAILHSHRRENLKSYIKRKSKTMECLRFEVSTAVTMKNVIFWDVMLCGSFKNRRFEGN